MTLYYSRYLCIYKFSYSKYRLTSWLDKGLYVRLGRYGLVLSWNPDA